MSHLTCVLCKKRLDFEFEDFYKTVISHLYNTKEIEHQAMYLHFAQLIGKCITDVKFIDEMYLH